MKLFKDLHYLPMSRRIFPLGFILPPYNFAPVLFCPRIILPPVILHPGNSLMIFTIYPCPISFFPLDSFCPPPYHFAPWKSFNDLHYLPMSHIIFPPGFILPPGENLFNDLHYLFPMSLIILPAGFNPWGWAVVL